MTIQLDNLKPAKVDKTKKRRIGRGNAAGQGTYSGRGLKGQRSRSGGKGGLKYKGFKRQLEQVPKKRGFTSRNKPAEVVSLAALSKAYAEGETVSPRSLLAKGLIEKTRNGVKVLGVGKLSKKMVFSKDITFSASAKESVTQAGGTIQS